MWQRRTSAFAGVCCALLVFADAPAGRERPKPASGDDLLVTRLTEVLKDKESGLAKRVNAAAALAKQADKAKGAVPAVVSLLEELLAARDFEPSFKGDKEDEDGRGFKADKGYKEKRP